jgi:hypothetical protein
VLVEILEEYLNVAERLASRYAGVEYEGILELIVHNSELVQTPGLPDRASEDPDDDKFLACALASRTTGSTALGIERRPNDDTPGSAVSDCF